MSSVTILKTKQVRTNGGTDLRVWIQRGNIIAPIDVRSLQGQKIPSSMGGIGWGVQCVMTLLVALRGKE